MKKLWKLIMIIAAWVMMPLAILVMGYEVAKAYIEDAFDGMDK